MTDLELVRLYLGDTDSSVYLVSDDQINTTLGLHANPFYAAAFLADSLAARFSRYTRRSIDGLSVDYSVIVKNYLDLAASLRQQGMNATLDTLNGARGIGLYAGGVYQDETDADDADASLKRSTFRMSQFDNPGV